MFACEMCGREFKNRSGLSGHKRMIHSESTRPLGEHLGSTSEYSTQELGQHSPSTRLSTIQALGERLEQQDEVLNTVLERLDEVLSRAPQHTHESSCHECHQFAEEVLNHGRGEGRAEGIQECHEHYQSIPGVSELRDRWIAAQEMVEDIPLIKVTRAENPGVVSTPEGDLRRGEMIKAEVNRKLPAMIEAAAQQQVGEIINGGITNRNEMTTAEVERKLGKKIYSR